MEQEKEQKSLNPELLESIFRTSKKTIIEYVREIERNNRYKSIRRDITTGAILDDRSRLIDLYEACIEQDAHIRSVIEKWNSKHLPHKKLSRINNL